jgi:hypothetical protein
MGEHSLRGQSSPLWTKFTPEAHFTPRGKLMLLKTGCRKDAEKTLKGPERKQAKPTKIKPLRVRQTTLLDTTNRFQDSTGLPDFSWYILPKREKFYQYTTKDTQCLSNISNGCKMDQTSMKYSKIFHCKTLQKLPQFWFLVWKYTIWQPCTTLARWKYS